MSNHTAKRRQRKATTKPSLNGHYRTVRKRVASLKPSPENQKIYSEVDADDHDMVKLAESIASEGLHEPLVITLDGYIVSGHRRHFAMQMNEQVLAPCRVLAVKRRDMTTDAYVALLRDHNRQRHKSVAEQVREELIDVDPEQAIHNLHERRERSVNNYDQEVEVLSIEGQSRRWNISDQKSQHVENVRKVIFGDRRDFWPLSVRGVHYALLNYTFFRNTAQKIRYKNDQQSYHATSDLVTRLRVDGTIPWTAISDETRPVTSFDAFQNVREFVRREVRNLFDGYWRDLQQSQPSYVELLVEKNTIYQMALRVTRKYQIPTSSGRGFSSIDLWHEINERYLASRKDRLVLIVLSDFDPEGELIPHVGGRTLRDEFGVSDLEIIKAGVTREQIERYALPPQNFAKESSANIKWFSDRNGGDKSVYELEAIHPAEMLSDLEGTITSVLDMSLFNGEVDEENNEATYLEAARKKAREALEGLED